MSPTDHRGLRIMAVTAPGSASRHPDQGQRRGGPGVTTATRTHHLGASGPADVLRGGGQGDSQVTMATGCQLM